jgi:hypothetical protein
LLSLLSKTQEVIRFASPRQCDEAFFELVQFCKTAASWKEHALCKSSFARKSLSDLLKEERNGQRKGPNSMMPPPPKRRSVCQCKPFTASCHPDHMDADARVLCHCCSEPRANSNIVVDLQSQDEYCADCLCSLAKAPYQLEAGEQEFDMMMSWTALHDDHWNWVPVVYDQFGVFRSLWKWFHERGLCGQTPLQSIESLVSETAQVVLGFGGKDSLNDAGLRNAWTAVLQDPTRARELMSIEGFINSVWVGVMKLVPFLSCISLHYVCQSSQEVGTKLCLLEEHMNKDVNQNEVGRGDQQVHFLVWNRHVAPQYDILVPKSQN